MALQLTTHCFLLKNYRVLWTSYIEQVIAQDEGGTQDDALVKVLSFFGREFLKGAKKHAKPYLCEARDSNGLELPEIFALVVPVDRVIIFGTESEARTAAEHVPQ